MDEPKEHAKAKIDHRLEESGRRIQNREEMNLYASERCCADREKA